MKKYKVYVPELHYLEVEVNAENEREAIEKANDFIAEEDISNCPLEYSHTIDEMDEWKTEEIK